jgi:hypothetical protein|tara:strand:- start:6195 stop:6332 length:138 start_codon:yes stop_codon:yes gene_type:complete
MIDLVTSTVGTIGWLYVAIIWKDRALIMMNTAIFIILVSGVLSNI